MTDRGQKTRLIITRILATLFVAYVLLNLGRALKQNYTVTNRIRSLNEDIAQLTAHIHRLQNQIIYFQSATYRELEAKRRLGLKLKGETVVLVPENVDPSPKAGMTDPVIAPEETTPPPVDIFDRASQNAGTWLTWFRNHGHSS